MAQETDVKLFRHTDTGAPELKGTAGSLLDLLHACLVTGYNTKAVDSMTRVDTTVTVTISAGQTYNLYTVIKVSGAEQSEYNGNHRITAVSSTTFEFELPTGVAPVTPATTATSLECCTAPAGWERVDVSVDGLRAIFKPLAPEATGCVLYVDDTGTVAHAYDACVRGYASAIDIDTRTDPFPYSAADDRWCRWRKANNTTTANSWAIVADELFFYIYNNWNGGAVHCDKLNGFGDMPSLLQFDNWNCIVAGTTHDSDTDYNSPIASFCEYDRDIGDTGMYLAKDYAGLDIGVSITTVYTPILQWASGGDIDDYLPRPLGGAYNFPYPPNGNGGVITHPVHYVEQNASNKPILRCTAPGMLAPAHDNYFSALEIVDSSVIGTPGPFIVLPFRSRRGSGGGWPGWDGQILVNILSSWR